MFYFNETSLCCSGSAAGLATGGPAGALSGGAAGKLAVETEYFLLALIHLFILFSGARSGADLGQAVGGQWR